MQLIGIALASYCIHQRIAQNFLAAFQFREDPVASRIGPDMRYLLAQTERDAKLAEVVTERLDDFPVHEVQND